MNVITKGCLQDFYLSVKIIAAITATVLAVYLAPVPDLGKGFALGVLVSSFIWFYLYLFSRERKLGKYHQDEVPNSQDAALFSRPENLSDANDINDKIELLVGYIYLNNNSASNTELHSVRSLIQEVKNLSFQK